MDAIVNNLKNHLRYDHSLGVVEMALKLNKIHNLGVDEEKIKWAGWLHDCCKYMSYDEQIDLLKSENFPLLNEETYLSLPVIHAFSGSVVAKKEYKIDDNDILNAICYHTTGRKNMSDLEKLIFISDYTELNRDGGNFLEVRKISYENLDKAIIKMYEYTFSYIKNKNEHIHSLSIEAYEYYKRRIEC